MRVLYLIFVCSFLLYLRADALSLAEKIAIAKQMAQDAAEGKIASGMVVDSTINVDEIARRFRASDEKKMRDRKGVVAAIKAASDEETKELTNAVTEERKESHQVSAENKQALSLPEPSLDDDGPLSKEERLKARQELQKTKQVETKVQVENAPAKSVADITTQKTEKTEKSPEKISSKSNAKPAQKTKDSDFVRDFYVGEIEKVFPSKTENPKPKSDRLIHAKLPKPIPLLNVETKLFSIYGAKNISTPLVSEIAKTCESLFGEVFLNKNSLSLPRTIELRIVDEKNSASATGAILNEDGRIVISANWSDKLKLDEFCRLLSGAVLRAFAHSNGFENWKNPPHWLDLALRVALEEKVRFGVLRDMARLADAEPASSSERVFAISKNDTSELSAAHAYWHLRAIGAMLPNADLRMKFFAECFSKNANPASLSVKLFEYSKSSELVWRCVVSGEIGSALGGIWTLEKSRAELLRFATVPLREGENITGIVGVDIFKHRENSEFIDELRRRLLEIKLALSRVNAVYFNAYLELGKCIESTLEDEQDSFYLAMENFVKEFKTSDEIADRVRKLIAR